MTPQQSTVVSVLDIIGTSAGRRSEVKACLSDFSALSDEQKRVQRSATIEKVFPLVWGDIVVVKTSEMFEQLRKSTW
jgi:hypothetical protein